VPTSRSTHRPHEGSWTDTKIFTGWKTRTRIIAPGDVTGDYLPAIDICG